MIESVLAIIITYNPKADLIDRLLCSLSTQCQIIVIDNCSLEENKEWLKRVASKYGLITVWLNSNKGIAAAQNKGIDYARKMPRVEYIVLFDQDSIPEDNTIECLLNAYKDLTLHTRNQVVVGPRLYDSRTKKYLKLHVQKAGLWIKITPKDRFTEVAGINSSGTFTSLKVFDIAGKMNERLFIDHVDTEWSFRVASMGIKLFVLSDTHLEHYMGDAIKKCLLTGDIPYRTPDRHYTLIRNSIFLYRYSHVPFTWKFWSVVKNIVNFCCFCFFDKLAKKQRQMMLRGLLDGLNDVK